MLVWIFYSPFLIVILLMAVTLCFPRAAVTFSAVGQTSSTSAKSFWYIQSFVSICFAFGHVEGLHLEDVFYLLLAVDFRKQVSIPVFFFHFHVSRSSCCDHFISKGEN